MNHSMYNKHMKYLFVFFCGFHFHLPAVNKAQTLDGTACKNKYIKSTDHFFFLIQTFHGSFIHEKYINVNLIHKKSFQMFALDGDGRNKQ